MKKIIILFSVVFLLFNNKTAFASSGAKVTIPDSIFVQQPSQADQDQPPQKSIESDALAQRSPGMVKNFFAKQFPQLGMKTKEEIRNQRADQLKKELDDKEIRAGILKDLYSKTDSKESQDDINKKLFFKAVDYQKRIEDAKPAEKATMSDWFKSWFTKDAQERYKIKKEYESIDETISRFRLAADNAKENIAKDENILTIKQLEQAEDKPQISYADAKKNLMRRLIYEQRKKDKQKNQVEGLEEMQRLLNEKVTQSKELPENTQTSLMIPPEDEKIIQQFPQQVTNSTEALDVFAATRSPTPQNWKEFHAQEVSNFREHLEREINSSKDYTDTFKQIKDCIEHLQDPIQLDPNKVLGEPSEEELNSFNQNVNKLENALLSQLKAKIKEDARKSKITLEEAFNNLTMIRDYEANNLIKNTNMIRYKDDYEKLSVAALNVINDALKELQPNQPEYKNKIMNLQSSFKAMHNNNTINNNQYKSLLTALKANSDLKIEDLKRSIQKIEPLTEKFPASKNEINAQIRLYKKSIQEIEKFQKLINIPPISEENPEIKQSSTILQTLSTEAQIPERLAPNNTYSTLERMIKESENKNATELRNEIFNATQNEQLPPKDAIKLFRLIKEKETPTLQVSEQQASPEKLQQVSEFKKKNPSDQRVYQNVFRKTDLNQHINNINTANIEQSENNMKLLDDFNHLTKEDQIILEKESPESYKKLIEIYELEEAARKAIQPSQQQTKNFLATEEKKKKRKNELKNNRIIDDFRDREKIIPVHQDLSAEQMKERLAALKNQRLKKELQTNNN